MAVASPRAVDVLNEASLTPGTPDQLQLRIINLRKRSVNAQGALAHSRDEAVLDQLQQAIYRAQSSGRAASAAQIRQWESELDRLGAD